MSEQLTATEKDIIAQSEIMERCITSTGYLKNMPLFRNCQLGYLFIFLVFFIIYFFGEGM